MTIPNAEVRVALADTLALHGRANPPGGQCHCGHEVGLGERFTLHQIDVLLDSPAGQEMLARVRAQALADAADAFAREGLSLTTGGWPASWPANQSLVQFALDVGDWLRLRAESEEIAPAQFFCGTHRCGACVGCLVMAERRDG